MPKQDSGAFTIGQLAQAASVNVQTIRFYERRGILKPTSRRESGYRIYNRESVKRLHFVRQAKDLGFSLKEIQGLLRMKIPSVKRCETVRKRAEDKLKDIQHKVEHLQNLEGTLSELIERCKNRKISDSCPILDNMEFDCCDTSTKRKARIG